MKRRERLLLGVILALYSLSSIAQETSDYSRLFVGQAEQPYSATQYNQSTYLGGNDEVQRGKICYFGKTYDNILMRYDLLKSQIVLCSPSTNILTVPDQDHVDWFEINGQRWVKHQYGISRFSMELSDGKNNGYRLLCPMWMQSNGSTVIDNRMIVDLKVISTYILEHPDGTNSVVTSASSIKKAVPEQSADINRIVKSNHLRFSKKNKASSLLTIVNNLAADKKVETAKMTGADKFATMQSSDFYPSNPDIWNLLSESDTTSIAIDKDKDIVAGIPVLDNRELYERKQITSTTYIVPGVKKAKESVSDDHELAEIVVVAGRQNAVKSTDLGMEKFKPQLLKNIPSAFGEVDIMKIVLSMPGVKSAGEASSGYNVRGSATDQNLIMFNNGTVFNPSHLFGIFSSFNSDMVEDVELFKGSMPAQYGGRISSVLKVTSKEANMQKFTGSASLGLLTSKLNLELPLIKDHMSLLLSGRTTYSDWILKNLPKKSGYKNGKANFYDLGGVLTWKFNNYHRLKLFGYFSHDTFSFTSNNNYGYSNQNVSLEYRAILKDNLTATLTAGVDHYDYYNEVKETPTMAARLSFGINEIWSRLHFVHRLNKNKLNYGASVQLYDVNPGTYKPVGTESTISYDKLEKEKALEGAIYAEDDITINEKLSFSVGARLSFYQAMGPYNVRCYPEGELPTETNLIETRRETGAFAKYLHPEIRLAGRYAITSNISLKAGFNTIHQYIHKVSNTSVMSPTDIWKLTDNNIKPQSGWQVSAGVFAQTDNKQYEFQLEGYMKRMTDYLNYRNGAVLVMNHHLETDVISTRGRSAGVEFQVKKPFGKFNGWISYCYSRTFLQQDDERVALPVNNGDWYPTEYDRPHEVKAVLNYKFTERYSLSSNFEYSTGRPTSVPAGQYIDRTTNTIQPFYTKRNGFRLPDYMRWDVAYNIEPTHRLTSLLHTSFSIGVYNVLGRKNAYNIYYVVEKGEIKGYRLSVFGCPIPYATINIKF